MSHGALMQPKGLLDCPTCALPAEIVDRFLLDGSPHPVEHVKLRCVDGHWFTIPTDAVRQNDGGPGSLFCRAVRYLKDLFAEYDYAQRRLLELKLGVPMR